MDTPIRLLLVDDHRLFVEGLKTLLAIIPGIEVVATAHSGDDALYQLRRFRVDVVLLDINMPGKDGIDVLQIIQHQQLPVQVKMLSSYDDQQLVKKCFSLGAKGYLLKNTSPQELETAIQTVARGGKYISPELKRIRSYREDPYDKFTLKYKLTDRELSVIRLIAEEKTSDEIADELCVSSHTVDATRKTLLKKLNVRSVVGIVNMAYRHLLVF